MRKPQTHVIAPPVRRKAVPLWLAAAGLLANAVLAIWAVQNPAAVERTWLKLGDVLRGQATWYGPELQGEATASGEPFDMNDLTAAHRTLPLGSHARVTNLANGQSVIVRINDRGPGRPGVMIDLSRAAAQAIGLKGSGTVEVAPVR